MSNRNNIVTAVFAVMSLALVGCKSQNATTKFAEKQDDSAATVVASSAEKAMEAQIKALSAKVGKLPVGTTIESLDAQIAQVFVDAGNDDERDPRIADRISLPRAMRQLLVLTAQKNFNYTYPREISGMRTLINAKKMRKSDPSETYSTMLEIQSKYIDASQVFVGPAAQKLDTAKKNLDEAVKSAQKAGVPADMSVLNPFKTSLDKADAELSAIVKKRDSYSSELLLIRAKNKKIFEKTKTIFKGVSKFVSTKIAEIEELNKFEEILPGLITHLGKELAGEQILNDAPTVKGAVTAQILELAIKDYDMLSDKFQAQTVKEIETAQAEVEKLEVVCSGGCRTYGGADAEDARLAFLKDQIVKLEAKLEKMKNTRTTLHAFLK